MLTIRVAKNEKIIINEDLVISVVNQNGRGPITCRLLIDGDKTKYNVKRVNAPEANKGEK